jgi:hypothetical protein
MMPGWLSIVSREIGHIALEMAPYIVLGLLAAVGVHALFPKDKIARWLGKRGLGSTVKASLAGIPLPLCSCGVVPMAMSLKKRGASPGATASFLVSTPETGVDSIAATYAVINPAMTILRPIAAFLTAVTTGLLVESLSPKKDGDEATDPAACSVCGEDSCEDNHSRRSRLWGSFRYVLNEFFPDIANWLVLGLILSGILAVLLPPDLFVGSSSLGQMAMATVVGVALYICASASTPIAAVLMAKGMTPGAALVFLLVGPATNIASLVVIARVLGRRTTAIYLGGVVASSVAIGLIVNATLGSLDWTPRIANPESSERLGLVHWFGALLLLTALLHVWSRQFGRWQHRRDLAATDPVV